MDKNKAKLVLDEAKKALSEIAQKHGLNLKPGRGRFDASSLSARIEFVEATAQAAQSLQAAVLSGYKFGVGDILPIKSRQYRVKEIKPSGVVMVDRLPDGKGFKVPAHLARQLSDKFLVAVKVSAPEVKVAEHPETTRSLRPESSILNDIRRVYSNLSPENLSCDGELGQTEVRNKYAALTRELKQLERELGRKVSEEQAFANN